MNPSSMVLVLANGGDELKFLLGEWGLIVTMAVALFCWAAARTAVSRVRAVVIGLSVLGALVSGFYLGRAVYAMSFTRTSGSGIVHAEVTSHALAWASAIALYFVVQVLVLLVVLRRLGPNASRFRVARMLVTMVVMPGLLCWYFSSATRLGIAEADDGQITLPEELLLAGIDEAGDLVVLHGSGLRERSVVVKGIGPDGIARWSEQRGKLDLVDRGGHVQESFKTDFLIGTLEQDAEFFSMPPREDLVSLNRSPTSVAGPMTVCRLGYSALDGLAIRTDATGNAPERWIGLTVYTPWVSRMFRRGVSIDRDLIMFELDGRGICVIDRQRLVVIKVADLTGWSVAKGTLKNATVMSGRQAEYPAPIFSGFRTLEDVKNVWGEPVDEFVTGGTGRKVSTFRREGRVLTVDSGPGGEVVRVSEGP